MRTFLIGPAAALAFLVSTGTTADGMAAHARPAGRLGCGSFFRVAPTKAYASQVTAGSHSLSLREARKLGYMEKCQVNPNARGYVRWFDHLLEAHLRGRILAAERLAYERAHPWSYAVASWYQDSGATCASGPCRSYGVANLSLPFGTRVTFFYHGRTVEAVVDDRGPYVGGRTFDLDQDVAGALGFSGVDTVGYRIG